MRIGLMRERIEIWDTTIKVNEYGVNEETKELYLACPAAVKHLKNEDVGGNTKSVNKQIEITVRYNRYFKTPSKGMYVIWDGQEWDVNTDDYYCSYQKYITLPCTKRSK